ncbi:MAG: DNA translocase FtsK [Rikenellaceae bacterium]|nr:DNA translocase FtsK [Rikenellaceae bacterium]
MASKGKSKSKEENKSKSKEESKSGSKSKTGETAPPPKGMEAFKLISGLFFLAFAVYTFISLGSYLFTWAEDQSLLSRSDVWSTLVPVENGGGKLGFFWANFLLSELFGLGAFVIPFFFLGISLYCLKIKRTSLLKLFFITVFGAIIFSIFFSYVFGFTKFDTWFGNGVGGSYGYYVNLWLLDMLGASGAGALIIVLMVFWLALVSFRVVKWLNKVIANTFHPERRDAAVLDDDVSEEVSAEAESASTLAAAYAAGSEEAEAADLNSKFKTQETIFEVAERENNTLTDSDGLPVAPFTPGAVGQEEMPFEVINEEPGEEDFLKNLPQGSLDTLFDPRLDLSHYKSPSLTLLEEYKDKVYDVSREELELNNKKIVKTLSDYKIGIERIFARPGPTVTLYEIVPQAGVRISQIKRLEDDIALQLAAKGVRIIAPIPGTNYVGIEVANNKPSIVSMRSVLDDAKFKANSTSYDLPIAIGRTISNEVLTLDLAKMPHLLVAGATGQGKSVGLNAIITSLLYTKHPSELKFVLVDPKKVELSLYERLEHHFLAKLPEGEDAIITDTQKVIYTLKSLLVEMESRYDLLTMARVRSIKEYNEKFLSRKLNPLKGHRFLPFIVVIIDEFADMLMTAGREVEDPITRLAQKARAIGIHLVIATQRPSVNVITGLIKSNFPARMAFKVISSIDSRTILDTTGANQLIGRGDMLFLSNIEITRVQCAFIDTKEIDRVVDFISGQQGYPTAHLLPEYVGEDGDGSSAGDVDLSRRDKMFEEAAKMIVQYQQGSTSLIQRRLNLGYNRAGRIMDQLEAAGIVGPSEGSKARQVLITDYDSLDRILNSLN